MLRLVEGENHILFKSDCKDWVLFFTMPFLLIVFGYLSRNNVALLVVMVSLFLVFIFSTTLITSSIMVDSISRQIKTFSVWNQSLESFTFDEIDYIDVSKTEWPDSGGQYEYVMGLKRKSGLDIGLNSGSVGHQIRSESEILQSFLKSKNSFTEIRLRFRDRYGN